MKVLAIVPARCGSKGFPHKNIAKIEDKTLLELAVKIGLDSNIIDDVYISTDCKEYENIAINAGAKSLGLRPEHLATDTAKSIDAILDILKKLDTEYTHIILLQPTSPLREPLDIDNIVKHMQDKSADAAVSVVKLEEPHPHKLKSIDKKGLIKPFLEGSISEIPRQMLPTVYALNGALYVTKTKILLKEKTFLPDNTIPYIMDTIINIDTEEDFIYLKALREYGKIKIYGVDK